MEKNEKQTVKDRASIFEAKNKQSDNIPKSKPLSFKVQNGMDNAPPPPSNVQKKDLTPISSETNSTPQNEIINQEIKKEFREKFPKDENDYLQKIKNIKHPLEGCKSIDQIKENGQSIKIYRYSQKQKKSDNKEYSVTILFVGQSGAGKSTVINAYVNFLLGVYYDQPCRYKIVVENNKKSKDVTKSQTDDVTIYYIRSPLYPGIVFKLIDTPGFADTENKKTESKLEESSVDKKHLSKFEEFFNTKFSEEENGVINGICFVVKSSENRVTNFQKLIISSLLNLFGKNAGSNFLALMTHADTNKPKAVDVMTKEIVEFRKKEENKEKWYWCVSSIKYFEILQTKADSGAFEDNITAFISFTKTIIDFPAVDMTLTKKNLFLKKTLNVLKKTIKEEYLTILLRKYDLLNTSAKNLGEQMKKCDEKKAELQKKLDEIKKKTDEQDKIQNNINSIQNEININNDKIKKCKSEITNYQNDLQSISQSISSLEKEIKNEEKRKNELIKGRNEAEKKLSEIQAQIEKAQRHNSLSLNIDDLEEQKTVQLSKLKTIKEDIESLDEKNDQLKEQISSNENKKVLLNKKIENSKNEIDNIEKEKDKKQNEQNEIMKRYDNNERTYSIDFFKDYMQQLEVSKSQTIKIKESYIESFEVECEERVLRCTSCKKNCHVDCDCKWGLFMFLGTSWWCNFIVDDHCKVCNCSYKNHNREKKRFKHVTKERTKIVGLSEKEIEDINKNIQEMQSNIDEGEKLEKNIRRLKTTEIKLESDKLKKKNLESNQKNKEQIISKKSEELEYAKNVISSKKLDMNKEKSEKTKVEKEVKKLTEQKDKLLKKIKNEFDKEKERLEKENDRIIKEINDTENEAIKHIIQMKIITDEIKKIEIAKNSETFDKQWKDILEDNKDFVKKSESFEPLKKKIEATLILPEEKILMLYGIDKKSFLNFDKSKNTIKK